MNFNKCVLTGQKLRSEDILTNCEQYLEYETDLVGRVKITQERYKMYRLSDMDERKYILAGICKNRTLKEEEPLLFDKEFIEFGYKNETYPKTYEEKCNYFLRFLYQIGGNEDKSITITSPDFSAIAYASREEFCRVMKNLRDRRLVSSKPPHNIGGVSFNQLWYDVLLTPFGKQNAERQLPQMPMVGLVNQEIATGDSAVDEKINHAKKIFFTEPRNIQNMRNACETLSFVIEPLRKELKSYLFKKDVEKFFEIVNDFEIRHNTANIKKFQYEEQLEWVFYTLLNALNLYSKMKKKFDQ